MEYYQEKSGGLGFQGEVASGAAVGAMVEGFKSAKDAVKKFKVNKE